MKKKFISIIWGYHKQIFFFNKDQNYHMLPIEAMNEEGFECEIFAIDSKVKIEDDPNFINGTKVIYYKGFYDYIIYLFKNRNAIIYSNSLTFKTLLVGIIGNKTVFCPHSYPFGHNIIKKLIIKFFYKFFKKIRINNKDEFTELNKIKKLIGNICPLSVSRFFLTKRKSKRNGGVWVGNITNIKNPLLLIKIGLIFKKSKIKFKISIIGEDRFILKGKNFQEIVYENCLEDYIEILGVKSHIDIKKILETKLIYINTSISEGQCLSVFEGALSGCFLCLQNIMSFPSVFKDNAFYHNNEIDLYNNILLILDKNNIYIDKIINNQNMILINYNYDLIKKKIKNLFLSL